MTLVSGKSTMVSKSEMVAYLTDYDETFAPKDGRALRLTLSADVAFIAVGKFTEKVGEDTFTTVADDTIGVDVELLYATLGAMIRRADRRSSDRAKEGTLPASDPAWTVEPVTQHLPGVRRRA